MKVSKVLLLSLFVSIICVGCSVVHADTTRDIRHSGFSLSSQEFECPVLLPDSDDYEKTKFLSSTYSITTEGSIYLLSMGQKYSNELNCKKANFSPKVVAIFDSSVVKADDGKMYYLAATGEHASFSQVTEADSDYVIYNAILKDEEVVKAITVDQENGHYYVLKTDGNVYNFVVSKNNGVASIVSSSIVYSKSNYGDNIIDFNYAGKSKSTFIKTSKQIFRMLASNEEECSKYVDVECQYEMTLDEGLTEHYDKILGFNGSFLLTTYGRQFNAANQNN